MSLIREIKDIIRFFKSDKNHKRITFYSENRIYYKYYEGIIDYLLKESEITISYITSDPDDPILKHNDKKFKTYYINKLLVFLFLYVDSEVFVMTMPDLNQFHIKRSINNVHYVYIFHAIMSTHMVYRKGAFDYYDTIFCVGKHHKEEIEETEKIYNLKSKKLVEVGYHLLEKIYDDYKDYLNKKHEENKKDKHLILVAPSWHEKNIFETNISEIVQNLLDGGYKVVVRPHPEFIKRRGHIVKEIGDKFKEYRDFNLEIDLISNKSFYEADVLITDWSGVAFEFAFGTERPVIFIDTPPKVHNQEYEKLQNIPLEVKSRAHLGKVLSPQEINKINSGIYDLLSNKDKYLKAILDFRDEYIYNWGNSSEVGARYLIDILNNN